MILFSLVAFSASVNGNGDNNDDSQNNNKIIGQKQAQNQSLSLTLHSKNLIATMLAFYCNVICLNAICSKTQIKLIACH